MESTKGTSPLKDLGSLENKQQVPDAVQKKIEELVDKIINALSESEEYFLDQKEHSLFLTLPATTAIRQLYVAINKKGVLLDPSSLRPHRVLPSSQTGFLLKKIS